MSKPKWLRDKESQARRVVVEPDLCKDCIYYGKCIKYTRHKGKEWVKVHECDIHPGCLCTQYSICCEDFMSGQLV